VGRRWRDPSTIGVHISRLRLARGTGADTVMTVRGAGYLLDVDRLDLER
jgi:DNA-binding response OmpR family regulator